MTVIFRHCLHSIPKNSITWAGICPWQRNYCFGCEKGTIGLSPFGREEMGKSTPNVRYITASSEPINGIAFLGSLAAITSRSNLTVFKRDRLFNYTFKEPPLLKKPIGAFGVIGVKSNEQFLAPIGTNGIIQLSSKKNQDIITNRLAPRDKCLNFYKIAVTKEEKSKTLVSAACRTNGLSAFSIASDNTKSNILNFSFGEVDVVDIAPINDLRAPNGVIGLGKNGELIWSPDILTGSNLRILHPRNKIGIAYSFLLVNGTGLILSENTLSCLPNLINHLIEGKSIDEAFTLPFIGEDLLPASPKSFFLISDGFAREFDIDVFINDARGLSPPPPSEYLWKFNISLAENVTPNIYENFDFKYTNTKEIQFAV